VPLSFAWKKRSKEKKGGPLSNEKKRNPDSPYLNKGKPLKNEEGKKQQRRNDVKERRGPSFERKAPVSEGEAPSEHTSREERGKNKKRAFA